MTLSQRERENAYGGAAVVLARSGEGLRCPTGRTAPPHPFGKRIAAVCEPQALSLWEREA
ncbi:hypothetical protein BREVUG8_110217 [Brevundimonas sp. G8]|nr:hypothetical protein BREVUG8_110217 [Brevundimonas sp. G8]